MHGQTDMSKTGCDLWPPFCNIRVTHKCSCILGNILPFGLLSPLRVGVSIPSTFNPRGRGWMMPRSMFYMVSQISPDGPDLQQPTEATALITHLPAILCSVFPGGLPSVPRIPAKQILSQVYFGGTPKLRQSLKSWSLYPIKPITKSLFNSGSGSQRRRAGGRGVKLSPEGWVAQEGSGGAWPF